MLILSIALGGCLKGPPVEFGLTEDTGGHITYVLGEAMELAERADVDRVEIVTRLIDDPELGAIYAQPLEWIGPKLAIRRLDSGDRRYLSKEAAIADRPAFLSALLRYIEDQPTKPDIVHAHFADAGAMALAVRERFGIPFLYTAHSLAIDKVMSGFTDADLSARVAEEDRIIGAADAVIASSRDEAERQLMLYRSACPSRIHCVPPGAALDRSDGDDIGHARALIAPFLRDPAKPIILAIARPVQKKNLAGLIDLYAQDTDLRARSNLVILAGLRDGPNSGEAEQRAVIAGLLERMDRHDLYGSLALPKRHDQRDVCALYGMARDTGGLFVNPAFTEPYGLTLAEAAVHGLPVVATAHGGAPDIVARLEHGRVADPRDPPAFAAAIRALLDDRTEWAKASSAGRRNGAKLDWKSYADRLMSIVGSLTRRDPAAAAKVSPQRLLLSDIDNTVTGCRPGAEELARFLRQDASLAFGVATGRSLQEALRLLAEWNMPDPELLITSVGAEIYWRNGGQVVPDAAYHAHIDHGWAPAVITARLAKMRGIAPQLAVEQRRHKLSYFASEPSVIAAVRDVVADLPVRVIHSHARLLDIVPERAGKGAAMIWAARTLNIPRDRVFAAGDSGNDLDMLTACRNPILVANHSDELASLLKSPAIYVAKRAYAGGVVEGMRAHSRRIAA
jgi:sucrose-phosphate synthase